MKTYRAIAAYYDAEYDGKEMLEQDVPFFLKQLPARRRLRVLDVACGTGRSSIPIAQAGHRVVGIDYARDMLKLAEVKRDAVGLTPREMKFVQQDARRIKLAERFDWATIFFNTLFAFVTLEQQDEVLQSVRSHLKPGGRIWIDVFQPNLELLSKSEQKACDVGFFYVPALDRTVQRSTDIARDPSTQIQRIKFHYRWFENSGVEKNATREFDLTFMFPRELRLVLERNSFSVETIYGDYDGSLLNADSPRMICVARKQ